MRTLAHHGDAEGDADRAADLRQYIAREKKRMIAAVQTARNAYQARLMIARTVKGETARTVWRRWGPDRLLRSRDLVFL
jgi:hypothetical protein